MGVAGMAVCLGLACGFGSCRDEPHVTAETSGQAAGRHSEEQDPNWLRPRSDERLREREQMVDVIRREYRLEDPRVLKAMRDVPRHWFVPTSEQDRAYADHPLPIGWDQTISQPFIVAYMTSLLKLSRKDKVLEIGTGSGYQAAVLNEFTPNVYTIEIVEPLARRTMGLLEKKGYKTIRVMTGDGYKGWAEHAPYDAVIVTCAPDHVPQPLVEQLKPGGRMAIPVGGERGLQELLLLTRREDGTLQRQSKMPVRFVPLVREKRRR